MKILILAPANSIHTQKWIQYYELKGYEYKLVTFFNHYNDKLKSNPNIHRLPKLLPGKLSYLANIFNIKKIVKQFSPDIFHAHYISSYGLLASLANYHPFFISVWGSDIYLTPQKSFIHRLITKYVILRADVICSTSYDMARELANYTDKHIEITPFGVDLEVFKPSTRSHTQQVITIGITKNLHRCYGVYELIGAIGLLVNEFSNIRLVVLGDGPDKSRCQALVEKLELTHIVDFLGFRPHEEMVKHLAAMDICVFPSYSESFGVAALEAGACGIPVIVNNVGGLPEVVRHKETGIIVENNSPECLADALRELIVDVKLRHRYGQNARKFISKYYDWHTNREIISHLYKSYFWNNMSKGKSPFRV